MIRTRGLGAALRRPARGSSGAPPHLTAARQQPLRAPAAAPRLPARSSASTPCQPCRAGSKRLLETTAAGSAVDEPAAAGRQDGAPLAEALLRRWLGAGSGDVPLHMESAPLRDTLCELTVAATLVTAGARKHVLLAVVVADGGGSAGAGRSSRPGSGSFRAADLPRPMLHWGCAARRGEKWHAPPSGWSTWPDVSHDARGGAWQTPLAEQSLPGGGVALTMLLQLPWDGVLRSGGLAFLVKTSSNQWLGNKVSRSDFFFSTAQLPELAGVAPGGGGATAAGAGLAGPDAPLDWDRLARVPEAPPPQQQRQQQQQHKEHRHEAEPELPNAGRREKEPAHDETQVCTLSARELRSAGATQLGAWMQQQPDLEVPSTGLEILHHEFPVQGHAGTPLVASSCVLLARADPDSPIDSRDPDTMQHVLLVAVIADAGLTGTRKPGLVLHWSAVAPGSAGGAPTAAPGGAQPVAALPDGWRTLPDLSWDAGAGFWDTPMSRSLFKGTQPAGMGQLERPTSPAPGAQRGGDSSSSGGSSKAGMYMSLLRLPLNGAFSAGGLLLSMRTARRQWVRHAGTRGPFYLDTSLHAARLGLQPGQQPAPGAAAPGASQPARPGGAGGAPALAPPPRAASPTLDEAKHRALTAAGLSEHDIVAFAASLAPSDTAAAAAAAGSAASRGAGASADPGSTPRPSSNAAQALSSAADLELQAHIAAHSHAPSAGKQQQQQQQQAPGGAAHPQDRQLSKEQLAAFLRGYEPAAPAWEVLLWGEAAAASDAVDVPALAPHPELVGRIAELEHKARRSLMHRYGIAADLVAELLPDLRAAAASAPGSLAWPPPPSQPSGGGAGARGARALAGLAAVAVWLRLSSLRLLCWNHNYNVKPREISAALDRLGAALVEVYGACPQLSGLVLLALSAAGRGGEGDMGQRIRDEILAVQQRNGCKGGMMEEWHQKLHNNSSPDDLAICDALLAYLASGQSLQAYWDSLAAAGITAERLASYDRPIRSDPQRFSDGQVPQLTADLQAYRRTLAAVHSGADLAAAVDGVLGYDAGECKGKRVQVAPLATVATPRLRTLLSALLLLVQSEAAPAAGSPGASPASSRPASPSSTTSSSTHNVNSKVTAMVEMERCLKVQALVVEARACLAGPLRGDACQGRLRDVLFLDLALELTARGALESGLAAVRAAAPSTLLGGLLALLQQPLACAALAALPGQGGSAGLAAVARQLQRLSSEDCPAGLDATAKARHALSLVERLRSLLAAASASATAVLQPTADALAAALDIPAQGPHGPVAMLAEEVVRGSAAAALSQLLTAVEPSLRRLAGVGAWSVVSRLPATVRGTLAPLAPCLSQLPPGTLPRSGAGGGSAAGSPVILVLQRLAGEEEVPPGVVAVVVLGDAPDVLSHCAVRARNGRVPVVACPSSEVAQVAHIAALAGKSVQLAIRGDEVSVTEAPAGDAAQDAAAAVEAVARQVAALGQPALGQPAGPWDGDWIIRPEAFAPGVVGQKALSTTRLLPGAAGAAARGGAAGAGAAGAAALSSAAAVSSAFDGGAAACEAAAAAAAADAGGAAAGGAPELPGWVHLPPSLALPHGTFEAVLRAPLNRDIAAKLKALAELVAATAAAHPGEPGACAEELGLIRSLVCQLVVPPGLQHELTTRLAELAPATAAAAAAANGNGSSSAAPSCDAVWRAIRSVWASQWNARAVAALSKAGLPLQHLRMGVLLQPLLPARYSFVAHTTNPGSGRADEVCVQLVLGLGESLVGNHAGRALGGVVRRDALLAALAAGPRHDAAPVPARAELLAAVDVQSFPSKDAAVAPPGLELPAARTGRGSGGASGAPVIMARSDSNAEDLPGFAGAGLFDSVASAPTMSVLLDYTGEPAVWDTAAAAALLWRCALASVAAEAAIAAQEAATAAAAAAGGSNGAAAAGSGLDVEGCITPDGRLWLLQARPQV